ncbi:MAG: cyclase family protein [Halobacteriales archaeon]
MTRYDVSQPVADGQSGYPDDPPVSVSEHASMDADGYRATTLSMSAHAGTHVDVPAHTEPGGRTVDAYRVDEFRFDAVRLDVTGRAPREPIERADLREAAAANDPEETFAADVVVLWTGWPEYRGTDWYRDHPFLTAGAAGWLADNGYHVAVDALSVDPTPSPNARPDEPDGVPAHHELLGRGRFVVENLANLADVPATFTLEAYPLAVEGAEAAPARAVAVVEE